MESTAGGRFEVRTARQHHLEAVFEAFLDARGYAEELCQAFCEHMVIVDLYLLPCDRDRGIVWRTQ